MNILVQVAQEDIDQATEKSRRNFARRIPLDKSCPIFIALQRIGKDSDFRVRSVSINYSDKVEIRLENRGKYKYFTMPKRALNFINKFDSAISTKKEVRLRPFTFSLRREDS